LHKPHCCNKIVVTEPAGTLYLRAGALERDIPKLKHSPALPLLDLTLGEALDGPSDFKKTRIPRPCKQGKCSRRVCPMQQQGKMSSSFELQTKSQTKPSYPGQQGP